MMYRLAWFGLVITIFSLVTAKEKVLLMLVDGLRWDRLGFDIPSLDIIQENGVRAEWTDPVFITVSSPSMMSIATGLYVESHGVMHNQAFDPETKEIDPGYLEGLNNTEWFNGGGEPIWITAESQGLKAGTFMYPGGQVPIGGQQPTRWQVSSTESREQYKNLTDRVDAIFDWLYGEDDLDVVLFHLEVIDNALHFTGFSAYTESIVDDVNDLIAYILKDKMKRDDVKDTLNLILTSDHGMAKMPFKKTIYLYDYINETKVEFIFANRGPVFQIKPIDGALDEIYNGLKNAHPALYVYKKEDFPERLHYANNPRNLPIIGYVDPTWTCLTKRFATIAAIADHGFDNEEMTMKSLFYALGPSFKKRYLAKHFESVNIYPLMCEILGIVPAPNNGSRDNYKDMLTSEHPPTNLPTRPHTEPPSCSGTTTTGMNLDIVFGVVLFSCYNVMMIK
ncbi:ectonucleotide pyrophosphatase/phosphodiesterase family member 7-like [Asterias amurensis]|uniref:ectonucleotide pyrophosphatase/phosphodiesterase family member 7-like n=1 Tax=Asterias amurensis TaxID=7602 RepID=UPI003AB3365B